ncbi:MAG: DUF1573 domain-containing protein [Planctomycetales bacterium]|nr:DUF1573 domain-containing protein [Planctomycetales bacterium]
MSRHRVRECEAPPSQKTGRLGRARQSLALPASGTTAGGGRAGSILLALCLAVAAGCDHAAEQQLKFRDPWAEKRAALAEARKAKEALDHLAQPTPRCALAQTDVEFEPLLPGAIGRRAVTIRNVGDAPLVLTAAETSSPSLTVDPATAEIAPGDAAELTLAWTARAGEEPFTETATVATNDPRVPKLELTATGSVLRELALHPPSLVFERGRSDKSSELCAFVTSEIWDDFEIAAAETSLAEATWKLEPADRGDLRLLGAKSGYLITYTTPKGMDHGRYQHTLSLTAAPADGEPQQIELPVVCKVLRKVAVYGEGIDADGVIRFGVVEAGEPHRRQFTVKVHDENPDVGEVVLTAEPSYVQAKLTPQATAQGNLYRLQVTIPADAPLEVHRGDTAGRLTIEFGHPALEPLELGLEFVTHSTRLQHLTSAR